MMSQGCNFHFPKRKPGLKGPGQRVHSRCVLDGDRNAGPYQPSWLSPKATSQPLTRLQTAQCSISHLRQPDPSLPAEITPACEHLQMETELAPRWRQEANTCLLTPISPTQKHPRQRRALSVMLNGIHTSQVGAGRVGGPRHPQALQVDTKTATTSKRGEESSLVKASKMTNVNLL